MDADDIALLVAEHRLTTPVQCSCGFRETDAHAGTWEAHLAAVLAPLVEQAKREGAAEAPRDAADYLPAEDRLPDEPTVRIAVKRWLRDRARAERAAQTPRDGGGS